MVSWDGKTVVDVTNAFGVPVEDLDGLPSAAVVARAFSGRQVGQGVQPSGLRRSCPPIRPRAAADG